MEELLLATGASRVLLQRLPRQSGSSIVAEAVQHGAGQIRHAADPEACDSATLERLTTTRQIVVSDDITPASSSTTTIAARFGVKAYMVAPLLEGEQLVGLIAVHDTRGPRHWSAVDQAALSQTQASLAGLNDRQADGDVLRDAAVQAILDQLRSALDAQRCTFRQPVQAAYEFPVTYESRGTGVLSLLGDFTIVQTGQPVIVKLLRDRAQVVQPDCRVASSEALFHTMLAHYGGLHAQIVTPFIVDDQLLGVLSVHELRHIRVWTSAETALAGRAAAMIGKLFQM